MIRKSLLLVFLLTLVIIIASGLPCVAAVSPAPLATNITVTNNFSGVPDLVRVTVATSGSIVQVYTVASGGTPIGGGISNGTLLDISIRQLGAKAGRVYVSVKTTGSTESLRTAKYFAAEPTTTAPNAINIVVANNAGMPDSVTVSGIASGDIVNIYTSTSAAIPIAGTISASSSASIPIWQLGKTAGKVYVSVTGTGHWESIRTAKDYTGEISTAPKATSFIISNNAGSPDTITNSLARIDFSGKLNPGDVYQVVYGSSQINGTVDSSGNLLITIPQLGSKAGTVGISVSSPNKSESAHVSVPYKGEQLTPALTSKNKITVMNKVGSGDTIKVEGLSSGDTIKVYSSATALEPIPSGIAQEVSGTAEATLTLPTTGKGSVFITNTSVAHAESTRTTATYDAEVTTKALLATQIKVDNYTGTNKDKVTVSGIALGDVINVYSDLAKTTLLGSGTPVELTPTKATALVQLASSTGTVYVTNTCSIPSVKAEGIPTGQTYTDVTTAPLAGNIIVINNQTSDDTITVSGLVYNSDVTIYSPAQPPTVPLPVKLTTGNCGQSGTAILTYPQLGISSGNILVSVTEPDKRESPKTPVIFGAEGPTTAIALSDIKAENFTEITDTVTVSGLLYHDIVNVYGDADKTQLLGSGTPTQEGIKSVEISCTLPNSGGGTIYVTKTTPGKNESLNTAFVYKSDASTAPITTNITRINTAGPNDSVLVKELANNDVVKIYKSDKITQLATGNTGDKVQVSVPLTFPTESPGTVCVSVTSINKSESLLVPVSYPGVPVSISPFINSAINNPGPSDSVTVSRVVYLDVIKLYVNGTIITPLCSATVTDKSATSIIMAVNLGLPSGIVRASKTSPNMCESPRVSRSFGGETQAPSADAVAITNNIGPADTVVVSGLANGDVVKVYDAASAGNILGAAVPSTGTSTNVSINLADLGGTVYVSVKNTDKAESTRTAKDYVPEMSVDPLTDNITIVNNTGSADTVSVSGLAAGDAVTVYDAAVDGSILGAAASTDGSPVSVDVALIDTGGTVYVSVTGTGKLESDRTAKTYLAEITKSIKLVPAVTLTVSGSVYGGDVEYATAEDVTSALPSTVTVTLEDNTTTADIPVTWADTDAYDAGIADTYTFTGSWGTLPAEIDNADSKAAPIVEVTISP